MKTPRKKRSRLWVYLLYVGLVTSLILAVTLARYASTTAGAATATVAAIAGGGEPIAGEPISMLLEGMSPGGAAKTLKFQVVNHSGDTVSQVAMDYDITVETTGNLPLHFSLTADTAGNTAQCGEILTAGLSQTVTGGAFPLDKNPQTHTYTLTAQWPDDKLDAGYASEIDLVTVTVTARQRLAEDETTPGT